MSRDNRKKTFIDPKVQGALGRRLVFHWLVFLAASAAFAFFIQLLSSPFRPIGDQLQSMWAIQGPFLIAGICMLPIFVKDTIALSHRFVGPLSRIHNVMRDVGRGKPVHPVRLRPHDFWHEFAADFNVVLERLNSPNQAANTTQDADAEELVAT